jgi:hypothetical protein
VTRPPWLLDTGDARAQFEPPAVADEAAAHALEDLADAELGVEIAPRVGACAAAPKARQSQHDVRQRQERNALRRPVGGDLRRRNSPQLLGVRAEEVAVELGAEAARHPVLEADVGSRARPALELPFDVAADDARAATERHFAEHVVELERIAIALGAVQDRARARAREQRIL